MVKFEYLSNYDYIWLFNLVVGSKKLYYVDKMANDQ